MIEKFVYALRYNNKLRRMTLHYGMKSHDVVTLPTELLQLRLYAGVSNDIAKLARHQFVARQLVVRPRVFLPTATAATAAATTAATAATAAAAISIFLWQRAHTADAIVVCCAADAVRSEAFALQEHLVR
jgi:hypothetical protein